MMVKSIYLSLLIIFSISHTCFAQSEDEENLDTIEAEVKKAENKPRLMESHSNTPAQSLKSVSDLSQLAPFSEVSVLQKRWMPKTGRFQLFGAFTTMANDPWFFTIGGTARVGYGFSEAWGLEFNYTSFSATSSSKAKDLEDNNGILTSTFVSPKSYMGANLVWTPFYGKITKMNESITPLDMYFYFGAGQLSMANSKKSAVSAFQAGTGQIFAVTRNVGLRWDLSVLNYSAESYDGVGGSFNNVLLTIGGSFYFPGVSER